MPDTNGLPPGLQGSRLYAGEYLLRRDREQGAPGFGAGAVTVVRDGNSLEGTGAALPRLRQIH